jgi:glycosyltransferase involved in cell wall biosynthesis
MFPQCAYYQSYIWAHDTELIPYGAPIQDQLIVKKWNNMIKGCICLTEWHKSIFSNHYPELTNKIHIINNGISMLEFPKVTTNKISNKFIYSSRPERGLARLIELWPRILEKLPDATLIVASYVPFPSNDKDTLLKQEMDKYNIRFLGELNTDALYNEMATAEFWLYPSYFSETSCITALEMLMSEVICLYYPVAGLVNTMSEYGVPVVEGTEIEKIVSLTEERKQELRANGKIYAESCSWENRVLLWQELLFKQLV